MTTFIDLSSDDMGEALDSWYEGCLRDEAYSGLLDAVRHHFLGDGTVGVEDVCVGSLIRQGSEWQVVFAKRYEPDGTITLGLYEWRSRGLDVSWYPVGEGERFLTESPF